MAGPRLLVVGLSAPARPAFPAAITQNLAISRRRRKLGEHAQSGVAINLIRAYAFCGFGPLANPSTFICRPPDAN